MRHAESRSEGPPAARRQAHGTANSRPSRSTIWNPVPWQRSQGMSVQRPAQALGEVAAAQLLLGLALDLPDALARQPQRLADLLERAGVLPVEAEAHLDDAALLVVQLLQHRPSNLLLEGALDQLQLDGGDRVLLQR